MKIRSIDKRWGYVAWHWARGAAIPEKKTHNTRIHTHLSIYNIHANGFACVFIYEFDRNAFDIKWLNLMPADIPTISIIWKAIKIFHFIPYFAHKISENNKMNISYPYDWVAEMTFSRVWFMSRMIKAFPDCMQLRLNYGLNVRHQLYLYMSWKGIRIYYYYTKILEWRMFLRQMRK